MRSGGLESQGLCQPSRAVLVVDGDANICRFSSVILLTQGYQVLRANDSLEAILLGAAHAATLDLLVVDAEMPRISGPLLAQCLALFRPDLRILYTSGDYTQPTIDGVPVLRKPFDPQQLIAAAFEAPEAFPGCRTVKNGLRQR